TPRVLLVTPTTAAANQQQYSGYWLRCSSPEGEEALVRGAGWNPATFLPTLNPIELNSPELQVLLAQGGVVNAINIRDLSCEQTRKLVSVDFPLQNGGVDRRYFLNWPDDTNDAGRAILRNVGCGELLQA